MAAKVGPQCRCTVLADQLGLAHRGLEALVPKPLHGPVSCTIIFGQLARIGPSSTQCAAGCTVIFGHLACIGPLSTQLAAAQDCHVGPHNLQLEEWLPRLAHDVNALTLLMSSSWPTEAWRPLCPSPCMGPFHAPAYFGN